VIANKFGVGSQMNDVVFLLAPPRRMSEEDALLLAAWIVAVCFPKRPLFDAILAEIMGS